MKHNDHQFIAQILDTSQYSGMARELQELEKLILTYSKFFEDILIRQYEFCKITMTHSAGILQKTKDNNNNILDTSLGMLAQNIGDFCSQIKQVNLQQRRSFQRYLQDANQLIEKFMQYKDDYILGAIKLYRNDETSTKDLNEQLVDCKKQYNDSLRLYQQALTDPTLLYNSNLKQQRFKNVQHKIRKVKECEHQLKIIMELLNSRRKTLCIDLLELKKIAEDTIYLILQNTYQISRNNITSLVSICQTWQHQNNRIKISTLRSKYSILSDPSKFNFDRSKEIDVDFRYLISEQKIYQQQQDNSNIDEFNENSFRSLRDISFNQSNESGDETVQQLPQFMTSDLSGLPTSQLIQYKEWINAYTKSIKDTCQQRNNTMLLVGQYFDGLITSLKRQGRPCIPLQELKPTQPPITLLKWYQSYQVYFGDIGVQNLSAQAQVHDLFNLYTMQLSIYLKNKQDSLFTIQNQMIKEQNIAFSSIDRQIEDLKKIQTQFLKSKGLVVNNRTIALSTMDSSVGSLTENKQIEIQFRQMISTTSKAICHLVENLDRYESKLFKTANEIIESSQQQFNSAISDLVQFQGMPFIQESMLIRQCKQSSLHTLKSRSAFHIFYRLTQQNSLILEQLMGNNLDVNLEYPHKYDEFYNLPQPEHLAMIDEQKYSESLNESQASLQEQDKNYEQQMNFIRDKIKVEPNEQLLHSYACALSERIQLQGRLYVTNRRLFFHSSFNSNNLFFGDTILNIPKQDILQIQKRTNAYIFDNSISIQTLKGQIFFATFFQRDLAYDLIIKVFSPKEQPELLINSNEQQSSRKGMIKLHPINFNEMELQQIQERTSRIQELAGPLLPVFLSEHIIEHPELTTRLFYKLIFGDSNVLSFYEKMKINGVKCLDVKLTKWTPSAPLEYDTEFGIQSILDTPDYHERVLNCQQPLPKSSVPFMPKICGCEEHQRVYFVSLDKFIIELTVRTFKIPYCDAYHVKMQYIVDQVPNGVKIDCRMEIVFHKSVMIQKVIESSSFTEIKKTNENVLFVFMQKEVNQYYNNLSGDMELQTEISEPISPQTTHANTRNYMRLCKYFVYIILFALFLTTSVYVCMNYVPKFSIKLEFNE